MTNILDAINELTGKVVREIKYEPGYCDLDVEFSDGSKLHINVYDECGQFVVTVEKNGKTIREEED